MGSKKEGDPSERIEDRKSAITRVVVGILSLLIAIPLWAGNMHLLFDDQADILGRIATRDGLLQAQLNMWQDTTSRELLLARMRGANAEWDFMGRTFLVLSLANVALTEPAEFIDADGPGGSDRSPERMLAIIDLILEDTLALEAEHGQRHFLMGYVDNGPFVDASARSVFVDGEIALMLAARQRVAVDERWVEPLADRVEYIVTQMNRGPVLSAESYPDECWTFCNSLALAAIKTSDSVTGEDHSPLFDTWLTMARTTLIDKNTGLLVSSYRHDGTHLDGPEGSSIFLVAHALQILDPEFASDQYRRAREQLGRGLWGFSWAREWPESWQGAMDVDSGPIVPILDASTGASGMALLGAGAFGDEDWLRELHTSLQVGGFPIWEHTDIASDSLSFAASNQVGDAVLLYSLVQGPLWRAVSGPAELAALGGAS